MKKLIVLILVFASGAAQAALVSRMDGQAYYDDVLNITWIADANLALSNQFGLSGVNFTGAGGAMTWDNTQAWITAMNGTNYLGVSNWRLPTADPLCAGQFNCTGSEMGHLFYNVLGGIAGSPISAIHNANYELFSNIRVDGGVKYWSDTEHSQGPQYAYTFYFGSYNGMQGYDAKSYNGVAWAVRDGDIGAAAVPIPAVAWLFASGLGLLAWMRRKQAA